MIFTGAHGCGYMQNQRSGYQNMFCSYRLLVHCKNGFVILTNLCHVSCGGVKRMSILSYSTQLPLDPPFILVANEAYQLHCFVHSLAMESANTLS